MAAKRRTPHRTPAGTLRRPDTRRTLTVKGDTLTAEFRSLMNKAAAQAGMTQVELVVAAVTEKAISILKGENEAAAGPPPAVVVDRLDAQDERIAALDADMRQRLDRIEQLVAEPQRQWWRRLFAK